MMRVPISSGMLLIVAAWLMAAALFGQTITLTSGDYRAILLASLAAMGAADALCAVVFFRGGRLRWVAVAIALPTVFLVADFLRRAPAVWDR